MQSISIQNQWMKISINFQYGLSSESVKDTNENETNDWINENALLRWNEWEEEKRRESQCFIEKAAKQLLLLSENPTHPHPSWSSEKKKNISNKLNVSTNYYNLSVDDREKLLILMNEWSKEELNKVSKIRTNNRPE